MESLITPPKLSPASHGCQELYPADDVDEKEDAAGIEEVEPLNLIVAESATAATRSNSLPLFTQLPLHVTASTDLCTIGASRIGGMECMPLRTPPGPYHYHVADQTKSLQELQNEVGALLEFRDLVIETFPDLKNKMASSTACSTITGIPTSSLATRRTEWEPGIRVRRKLMHKDQEMSPASLSRSRSNSHSGKKEPKSGESVVIQDSGFSTETSSSKETHSASSTTTATATTTLSGSRAPSGMALTLVAGDHHPSNELWNLLDVIHRKTLRLREEVDQRTLSISGGSSSSNGTEVGVSKSLQLSFQKQLTRMSTDDVQILRKERDRLLAQLNEMEVETIAGRLKIAGMQSEITGLSLNKKELEMKLKMALSQTLELNNGIRDLHKQHVDPGARLLAVQKRQRSSTRSDDGKESVVDTPSDEINCDVEAVQREVMMNGNLGRLDGVVSTPNRMNKVRLLDSKKIASILLETNYVELQRHLLTLTVQNQVLQQKLDHATRSKIHLIKRMEKAREDMEDLRFQLEEKNIEFEGTRAQLRILESKKGASKCVDPMQSPSRSLPMNNGDSHIGTDEEDDHELLARDHRLQVSPPSMKAMVPLAMNDDLNLQHSSSTESAHDQMEAQLRQQGLTDGTSATSMPKKRIPSRIPLPGAGSNASTPSAYSKAPKPPTGRRTMMTSGSGSNSNQNISGPPSNRSLGNSNRQALNASNTSLNKRDPASLTRPESAQSWRKDQQTPNTSPQRNTSTPHGSSIPVSTLNTSLGSSPVRNRSTPIGAASSAGGGGVNGKQSSLRARNLMDSLTGPMVKSPSNSMSSKLSASSATTPVTMILNSGVGGRRDSYGSASTLGRKVAGTSAVPVGRRLSSSSSNRSINIGGGGGKDVDTNSNGGDAGTVMENSKVRNLRSSFWNWLKI